MFQTEETTKSDNGFVPQYKFQCKNNGDRMSRRIYRNICNDATSKVVRDHRQHKKSFGLEVHRMFSLPLDLPMQPIRFLFAKYVLVGTESLVPRLNSVEFIVHKTRGTIRTLIVTFWIFIIIQKSYGRCSRMFQVKRVYKC